MFKLKLCCCCIDKGIDEGVIQHIKLIGEMNGNVFDNDNGSNWFSEKRDLVRKYFRVCRMKSCCCFVDNGNDESAIQRRESYVEMNDDGFDDDNFTSGIGNNVNHVGGDDEYHQL